MSLPEPAPHSQIGDVSKIWGNAAHMFERPRVLFARLRFVSTVLSKTFDTLSPLSVDSTTTLATAITQMPINMGFLLDLLKANTRIRQKSVIVQLPRDPERIS